MNNEEKIVELLTALTAKVDKQGEALERLEERVGELDDRSLRSAVTLENQVLPQMQALYEGHGAIMEKLDKLASKSRVEELEDDVAMLKDSIKLLRLEVNELKKAQ